MSEQQSACAQLLWLLLGQAVTLPAPDGISLRECVLELSLEIYNNFSRAFSSQLKQRESLSQGLSGKDVISWRIFSSLGWLRKHFPMKAPSQTLGARSCTWEVCARGAHEVGRRARQIRNKLKDYRGRRIKKKWEYSEARDKKGRIIWCSPADGSLNLRRLQLTRIKNPTFS